MDVMDLIALKRAGSRILAREITGADVMGILQMLATEATPEQADTIAKGVRLATAESDQTLADFFTSGGPLKMLANPNQAIPAPEERLPEIARCECGKLVWLKRS